MVPTVLSALCQAAALPIIILVFSILLLRYGNCFWRLAKKNSKVLVEESATAAQRVWAGVEEVVEKSNPATPHQGSCSERCLGDNDRAQTLSWASGQFPSPQALTAPLRLDQRYAQPHAPSLPLLHLGCSRPCQACNAAHGPGPTTFETCSGASIPTDMSASSVAMAVTAASRLKLSGDGSPLPANPGFASAACGPKQGADHATPAVIAASCLASSSSIPLDTACRPDNKPSAYDTARAIVSQALSQPYTPMFTLGRVALKIPDRHPSDLPPASVWTRPYCEALECEGLALVGAYVREGCVHIVLDIIDWGEVREDEGQDAALIGGEDSPRSRRALTYNRLLSGPAPAPSGDIRGGGTNAGDGRTSGGRVGSSRSTAISTATRPATAGGGSGARRSSTVNDLRPGAVDAGLVVAVVVGRTSAPGQLQPQRQPQAQAPVPGQNPWQASQAVARGDQQQQQALRQQHQRTSRRHAPARVWSAGAAVAPGTSTEIAAGSRSGSSNNLRRLAGRPADGEGPRRGGEAGGFGVNSDGQGDGGGSSTHARAQSPATRRLRQSRRASLPLLSAIARQATHPAAHSELAPGLVAAQRGGSRGTSAGVGAVHDTSAGAASAAACQRLMDVLPPAIWVELLGSAVGWAGQNVTVQMPGGAGAWSVQIGAEVPARRAPSGGNPPDLMCISPPCVLAGAEGPLILYAAGADLQGVATAGASQRPGAPAGGEGAAAARGAGPLTVHVRYRGTYQPCRASLLGDQMPVEALSRVLPLDALRRTDVLCLQLARAPAVPGLMFVECQRGNMLGAALPVLVAPNSGVWQEVGALANDSAQDGGPRRTMVHRLIADLGLWLDYLATAPLPAVPPPQQQQQQQQPQDCFPGAGGAGRPWGEPAALSSAAAATPTEDAAVLVSHGRDAACSPAGTAADGPGDEVLCGVAGSRDCGAAEGDGTGAADADAARGGRQGDGDGLAGGLNRLFGRSLLRLLSNADLALHEQQQRRQQQPEDGGTEEGNVGLQGLTNSQLSAVDEDEGRGGPVASVHGARPVELRPEVSLQEQQHQQQDHYPQHQQQQGQQGLLLTSCAEQALQLPGLGRGGVECGTQDLGLGPSAPGAAEAAAGGPRAWEQRLGMAYGSCPGSGAEDPTAIDGVITEAGAYGRTISDPQPAAAGPFTAAASSCAPLSRFAEARRTAPARPLECGGDGGGGNDGGEEAMLESLPQGATSPMASSNPNGLSSDGLKRLAMIGAITPVGPGCRNLSSGGGGDGGVSDAGVGGAGPLGQLHNWSGPVLPAIPVAAFPPPPHGQSLYNCRMEIPEPLSPAAAEGQIGKGAVAMHTPETPSQLLRLQPITDDLGPAERSQQLLQQHVAGSSGDGDGAAAVAHLEVADRASYRYAGGAGTGTLLAIPASELEALSAVLTAASTLTPGVAVAAAGLLPLPPVRMDSAGTELHSWDSLTDIGTAAAAQLNGGAASAPSGRMVREVLLAPSPPRSFSLLRSCHGTPPNAESPSTGANGGGGCFGLSIVSRRSLRGGEAVGNRSTGTPTGAAGRVPAGCSRWYPSNSAPGVSARTGAVRGAAVFRSRSANLEAVEPRSRAVGVGVGVGAVKEGPPLRVAPHVAADVGAMLGSLPLPGSRPACSTDAPPPPSPAARPETYLASPATATCAAGAAASRFTEGTVSRLRGEEEKEEEEQLLLSAALSRCAAANASTLRHPVAPRPAPAAATAAIGPALDLLAVLAELESHAAPLPRSPCQAAPRLLASPPPPQPEASGSADGLVAAARSTAAAAPIGAVPGAAEHLSFPVGAADWEPALQGSWPAAGSGAAQALAARMRYMGVGLLAFSVQRGWLHTTMELVAGLSRLGMGLAEVDAALATREGGLGLLHLAVIAHNPALLQSLLQVGSGPGRRAGVLADGQEGVSGVVAGADQFAWDVGARGPGGLTPLHFATALDDGGEVAYLLLKAFPEASRLWFTAGDDSGCTPAEMATQARLDGVNQMAMAKLAELEFELLQQMQQAHAQPQQFAKHQPYRMHEPMQADLRSLHGIPQHWQQQPHLPELPRLGSAVAGAGSSAAVQGAAAVAAAPSCSNQASRPPDEGAQGPSTAANQKDDASQSLIVAGRAGGDAWRPWVRHAVTLARASVRGWPDSQLERQYRAFRASSLSAVDVTCGVIFTALFLLPAVDLARRREHSELISHCIFNAGLLGPYILRLVAPRLFLLRRNAVLLLGDACKAVLVLLTVAGVLPFPNVWANFSRGNMDIIMLVVIKPLAEQVIFPVAVLQRIVGTLADTYIYAYVTYTGALVPAFVRSTLQNLAAVVLLLLLDVRARISFERSRRAGCSASALHGSGGSMEGVGRGMGALQ